MPAKLYMDVQVPQAVTTQPRRRHVDVLMAQEDGAQTLEDPALLQKAAELNRVMVTLDIRFCALAGAWQQEGRTFAGLAFADPLEITIGQLVRDLELIALASDEGETEDQIFHVPF